MVKSVLKIVLGVGLVAGAALAISAQAQTPPEPGTAPRAPIPQNACHLQGSSIVCDSTAPAAAPGAAAAPAAAARTPIAMAQSSKVGSLVNPYQAKEDAHDQALADEGHKLFSNYGCPGCHGGNGGGGMCPPINNGVWIYGDADDSLFRLVSLGSVDLQKQGFSRKAIENIVAPMPSFGSIITKPDDLWKIVSWIKISAYQNTHSNK